ncbi:MAG: hypothetical protein ACTSW1_10135 [Candidatus Hodarchaeales archaeon]
MAPEQCKMIEYFADMLGKEFSINVLTLRGICLKSIQKWQIENKITAEQLRNATPSDRIEQAKEIGKNVREYMYKIIRDPEYKPLIDTL